MAKIADGRIVDGAIVTTVRFREGARVTVIQHDDRPPVALSSDEKADVLAGIREIEQGQALPVARLRARLRRRRAPR